MKIISTLLIGLLLVNFQLNAQEQLSCANAQIISPGTFTVIEMPSIFGTPDSQVPNPECAENSGGLRTCWKMVSIHLRR